MRRFVLLILCLLLAGCVFDSKIMKFKFPSSGQSIEDAVVITQTLLGNSLKPLAPVNLTLYRSLGFTGFSPPLNAGNIGIEWTRRSRIAPGLRPDSDVPIAEEITHYEVDIMNGANVVRTITVYPSDPTPILWTHLPGSGANSGALGVYQYENESEAGSLFTSGTAPGLTWSQQILNVGSDDITISFTTNTNETGVGTYTVPYRIGLIPETSFALNPRAGWFPIIGFQRGINSSTEQTLGLATNVNLVNTKTNLVIKVDRSGRVSLYQDPIDGFGIPLGPETVSIPPGPYRFLQRNFTTLFSDDCNAYEIMRPKIVRLDRPSCVYYLRDVQADFGSIPSTLTVRVYQVSAIVGRGAYAEKTFTL